MKNLELITLHQKAITILHDVEACNSAIGDFKKRIEIEENKDKIERYLTMSKTWLEGQISSTQNMIKTLNLEYTKIMLQINNFNN